MNNENETILIAGNDPQSRGHLELALRSIGYSVEIVRDGREVLSYLESSRQDTTAVVLDVVTPQDDTLDTLKEIRRNDPDLPVIMISETASTRHIVAAMRSGATDFLSKPVSHEELRSSISRSLDRKGNDPAGPRSTPVIFIGQNPELKNLYKIIQEISWSDVPVLILGETGSGKEIVARELHARSSRRRNRFIKLNCAALPSELVESELFGYERGAFTGASQRKAGIFETAEGGTILLDEIGDMEVGLQAKLLQVLQDREFYRVGGTKPIKIDVRVMAATHRNLEAAVLEGSFREDLFYRLNVVDIHVPPLRERKGDIRGLSDFFIAKYARPGVDPPHISSELWRTMEDYHWPGNVRELENFVQKLIVTRDIDKLGRDLLTRATQRPSPGQELPSGHRPTSPILELVTKEKEQAEMDTIVAALNTTGWNRKRAAALLKNDYRGLLYKMKKLGIGKRAGDDASALSNAS